MGVDALLDGAQFNIMSEGPPLTLSHDAVILYGNIELPVSCIHGVAAAPQCIVRWHEELDRFERFDSEVTLYVAVEGLHISFHRLQSSIWHLIL